MNEEALDDFFTPTDNDGAFEISENDEDDEYHMNNFMDTFPTTSAGEYSFEVEEDITRGQYFNEKIIMNQCGFLLSCSNNFIK